MERITSRKNPFIAHLRRLSVDGDYRRERGETVLDGEKLLREALSSGAEVTSLIASGDGRPELSCPVYSAPGELVEYASPVRSSPGPVFTVRLPEMRAPESAERALILENVQDPGNVGTVIRTADALDVDLVVLVGDCADVTSPRVIRASMGAAFRQSLVTTDLMGLSALLGKYALPLYGAALSMEAEDLRAVDITHAAVAVGNEGHGLSEGLLALCDKTLIIPISPKAESLNASVAAALIMWEMVR